MRAPSQTLYCNNLNDQITKQDLRRSLFHLFSQFGNVIDVVALKTPRMRGQAWVVFDMTMAATNALRQLQGFPFYGKAMRIDYAKTTSDAVAKTQKGYVPRYKRKVAVGPQKPEGGGGGADGDDTGDAKRLANGDAEEEEEEEEGGSAQEQQKPMTANGAAPNKVIIASELPAGCTADNLALLFRQYRGFQKAKTVAEKKLAFVEFEDADCAELALQGLQGFNLSKTHVLHLNFAK